jgi:hypothetical protein
MADSSRWFSLLRPAPVPDPVPATAGQDPAVPDQEPAGPRGERTKTVAVRLTPDEHKVWVAAAEAEGRWQMGRWVRETVTARLEDRPAVGPVEATAEVRQMRAELARMGSNLNQIARALNVSALGGAPAPALEDIARNLDVVRGQLGAVRDELRGR